VSARVRRGAGEELRLWYRFPAEFAPAQPDGSPFLAGALAWAMENGEGLTVDGPVSPRLLAAVDGIMAVYRSMYPNRFRPVEVHAQEGAPPPGHDLTGCFFSRGADSWYAVLTALEDPDQRPPLTHLVFSRDFYPVDEWSPELMDSRAAATLAAAARTGCEVVQVHTSQKRDFGGAQLTASALAMGFSRMLIPSGSMHGELVPAGTHPVLDFRYSTERTEIVHYGDANRLDKVERLARSQDALDTLHVCRWNGAVSEENCCRCEKCLRTMLELHLAGALDRAKLFPEPLTAEAVVRMRKRLGVNRHIWWEALHALGDGPFDRRLAAAVRFTIAQSDLRETIFALRQAAGDPVLAELMPSLAEKTQRAKKLVHWSYKLIDPDIAEDPPLKLEGTVRPVPEERTVLPLRPRRRGEAGG
jgi:hypothetical protein